MQDKILLAHGSRGKLSHDLIEKLFLPHFDNPILARLDDSALIELESGARLAFTTDSYVVSPLFFPGGDIGKLAICGTINDLAMSGAKPLYMSASFIIEEGSPVTDLKRIVLSMRKVAEESGVKIVAGDTKVVGEGTADGIFINTTGVGLIPEGGADLWSQRQTRGYDNNKRYSWRPQDRHHEPKGRVRVRLLFRERLRPPPGVSSPDAGGFARDPLPPKPHQRRLGHHSQ